MVIDTSWRGRRVFISGDVEFLGHALVNELIRQGAEVVVFVPNRPTGDQLQADFRHQLHLIYGRTDNLFRLHSAMAVHEIGVVFHCAAALTRDQSAEKQELATLLQAAGLYSPHVPVVACFPSSLDHQETEVGHERLSVVRVGEVFGPGDRRGGGIVSHIARALCRGEAIGDWDGPARDFIFVRDVATACLLVAQSTVPPRGGAWIFRSGWSMTDRQMARLMEGVWNTRNPELPPFPRPDNPRGWQPNHTLREALSETLAWYHDLVAAEDHPTRRAA
ncbi:MAG: NAD(P)-dependent oxidoreductase [Gemmataceae bacterium]|nr:NAD(P)-dependent oxidoreductase [Gemmata sp.]MDW8196756.1 NAD(P)-dependent oxidoreductase [Gemmataceae bacterium]